MLSRTARRQGAALAARVRVQAGLAQAQETLVAHKDGKVLHPDLLNANVRNAEYAVRGELYLKARKAAQAGDAAVDWATHAPTPQAEELRRAGKEIIFTNVGNPHALGQKPLTFNRQVMSLVMSPGLLEHPKVGELFSADVVQRAKETLAKIPGGFGAYSDSRGSLAIRKEVAAFIKQRDGLAVEPNPDHIFLTDGASVGVRSCLNALIRDKRDGVLVPIPQYPLYSASIALYGGSLVPYSLDEKKGWQMDIGGMKGAIAKGQARGVNARALVFINPGNPTGQCLPEANLRELVKFAYHNKIVLMADEVYQENIYQDVTPFVSARKVMKDLGEPYASGVELISFHTVSKGTLGECGMRGGYFEMFNIAQGTVDEIYKVASINLSPNVVGQAMMSLMVNPPAMGTPARAGLEAEKAAILASLRKRAHMMTDGFNSLEGVTCNFTEGAMYSFPQLHLPAKAIAAAKAAGKAPDVFYCLRLVEATGISTVPGSGFGQEEGTFHMRTTILPSEEKMKDVVERLQKFHAAFMKEFK